jgi:hypothetical protein
MIFIETHNMNLNIIITNVLRESFENYRIKSLRDVNFKDVKIFLYKNFPNYPTDIIDEEISSLSYDKSLVAISENKIIGCLLFSEENLCDYIKNTPILKIDKKVDWNFICNNKGLKGIIYAIDQKFRGSPLNYDFLNISKNYKSEYPYLFGLVYSNLKTHNLWKRIGMTNVGTVIEDTDTVEIYLM